MTESEKMEKFKATPFRWDKRSEEAASLLAADKLSDEKIAEKVGVHRATLARWKHHPAFTARIEEQIEEFRKKVRRRGIAVMERRIAALDDRWNRFQQIIEERAADPEMQEVKGGSTGMLVRQIKSIRKGEGFETVELYAVDTGLAAEMRNTEKQAAQELGQWTERTQLFGDKDKPVVVQVLNGVTMEEL